MVSKPRHGGAGRGFRNRQKTAGKHGGKPNQIKISNLHPDLTEKDLAGLMETIGPVEKVEIVTNTQGKSVGVAIVDFVHGKNAMAAIRKFNGRLAAGQTITVESTMSLSDRLVAANRGNAGSKPKSQQVPQQAKKSKKQPKKSLQDLDEELSNYMKSEGGDAEPDATVGQAGVDPAVESSIEVPAESNVQVPVESSVEVPVVEIAAFPATDVMME